MINIIVFWLFLGIIIASGCAIASYMDFLFWEQCPPEKKLEIMARRDRHRRRALSLLARVGL